MVLESLVVGILVVLVVVVVGVLVRVVDELEVSEVPVLLGTIVDVSFLPVGVLVAA